MKSIFEGLRARRLVSEFLRTDTFSKQADKIGEDLAKLKTSKPVAGKRLYDALIGSSNSDIRYRAILGLVRVGMTEEMLEGVLETLKEDRLRPFAVRLLKEYRQNAEIVVPALITAYSAEKDQRLRDAIVYALGSYGSAAKAAIPLLREHLFQPADALEASMALDRIGTDTLDEEALFMVRLLKGWSHERPEAQLFEIGKKLVPMLERFLLSAKPWIDSHHAGDFAWGTVLKIYAEACDKSYRPPQMLLANLSDLAHLIDLRGARLDEAREIAGMLITKYPLSDSKLILRELVSGSSSAKVAVRRCIELSLRGPEVVEALIKVAGDWENKDAQIEAIKYLGMLGKDANAALSTLRKVKEAASRPITREDFQEQERILGHLTRSIMTRIENKDPVSPDRMEAAEKAIEAIESSKGAH